MKWLNVLTVLMFKMHNVGTVHTCKKHLIGTVPTFQKLKRKYPKESNRWERRSNEEGSSYIEAFERILLLSRLHKRLECITEDFWGT